MHMALNYRILIHLNPHLPIDYRNLGEADGAEKKHNYVAGVYCRAYARQVKCRKL